MHWTSVSAQGATMSANDSVHNPRRRGRPSRAKGSGPASGGGSEVATGALPGVSSRLYPTVVRHARGFRSTALIGRWARLHWLHRLPRAGAATGRCRRHRGKPDVGPAGRRRRPTTSAAPPRPAGALPSAGPHEAPLARVLASALQARPRSRTEALPRSRAEASPPATPQRLPPLARGQRPASGPQRPRWRWLRRA